MSSYVQQAGLISGRHMTLAAVIGLHALVISALLLIRAVPTLVDKVDIFKFVQPVEEIRTVPPPPTTKIADVTPPTVTTVVPNPIFETTIESRENTITVQQGSNVVEGPIESPQGNAGTAVAPPRVVTELQFRVTRPTEDYYPNASIAMEEQGIAIVRVCVDAAGRIEGQPSVQTTSGHKRLDTAALRWARESLRFTPATENGVAIPACKGFRVNFNLR